MSKTPKTDEAWENEHPLHRLSDNEKRELCGKFEEEAERLKTALHRAARWGIRSDGFSGEVSDSLRVWIDGGMVGDPPEVPSYYPQHNELIDAPDEDRRKIDFILAEFPRNWKPEQAIV